jgi:hypothetical protein
MRCALAVFVIAALAAVPARAQNAGEPCDKFGRTIVSDDKKRVLACLRDHLGDPSSPLVWELNTQAPQAWQPDGDKGQNPFYTIGPQQKAK